MAKWWRGHIRGLGASGVLYGLSLIAPAYVIDYYGTPMYEFGGVALLLGPVGLFAGHFSWLANVPLWGAWFALQKRRPVLAAFLSLLAMAVAATFLLGREIPAGDAGIFQYKPHVGYGLWLASMALTLVAACFQFRQPQPVAAKRF